MNVPIITTLVLMFLASYATAQETSMDIRVVPVAQEFPPVMSPQWGGDMAITNREPLGRPSGAARANGVAFVAVPDTGLVPNRGLVKYRTTNYGDTWTAAWSISPSLIIPKTKMVRARNDSLYLFFLTNGDLYCWNVEATLLTNLTGSYPPVRDFDVVASANGNIYALIDIGETNQIFTFRSTNYGATWGAQIFTQNGAHPRAYINTIFGRRDTVFVSYYSAINPDTARSLLMFSRWRENNNLLEVIDQRVIDDDTTYNRNEHQPVRVDNVVWFFNTRENPSGSDSHIRVRVSTNMGATFTNPSTIAGTSIHEYWFDAAHYSDGVDFIYYADSAGTSNDRLMYLSMEKASPTVVQGRRRISNHPPVWSTRGYLPSIIEYPNGDIGTIWVGLDGATRKVFYDRAFASPLDVESNPDAVPEGFALMQNYPNPFNPVTTIRFRVQGSGQVTLKVYDVLGREVRTLVNENLHAGSYEVTFDATGLASGVYFYRLTVVPSTRRENGQPGEFVATRKMLLVR